MFIALAQPASPSKVENGGKSEYFFFFYLETITLIQHEERMHRTLHVK